MVFYYLWLFFPRVFHVFFRVICGVLWFSRVFYGFSKCEPSILL